MGASSSVLFVFRTVFDACGSAGVLIVSNGAKKVLVVEEEAVVMPKNVSIEKAHERGSSSPGSSPPLSIHPRTPVTRPLDSSRRQSSGSHTSIKDSQQLCCSSGVPLSPSKMIFKPPTNQRIVRSCERPMQTLFLSVCFILTIASSIVTTQPITTPRSDQIINGMKCAIEQGELSCSANLSIDAVSESLRDGLKPIDTYQRFRTIDLVFSEGNMHVNEGFFDKLQSLYFDESVEQDPDTNLEFRVKFQNFDHLQIGPKAFSNVFPAAYRNQEGEPTGGPNRPLNMVVNVYNSKAAYADIAEDVFDGLSVSSLTIHNADLSHFDFERLFANSFINTLDLKGSYIQSRDGNPDHFSGKVDKVILIKQAAGLDSNEFPKYPVHSYTLIAQNIHRIDGQSLVNHTNVHELQIKSRNCSLKSGDLDHLPNLKSLTLEGVVVEPNAFENLHNLEYVQIGDGVTITPEDAKQLTSLPKLKKFNYNLRSDQMDENARCELISGIFNNPNLRRSTDFELSDSRESCSCEHVMSARLSGSQHSPCYQADEELINRCSQSPCGVVTDFFEKINTIFTPIPPTNEYRPQHPHETAQRVHLAQAGNLPDESVSRTEFQEDVESFSSVDVSMSSSTAPTYQAPNLLTPAAPMESDLKKNKFNWLPIIVIFSVVIALILIGVLVFLVRKRRERNREFKPIPTSDTSATTAAKR